MNHVYFGDDYGLRHMSLKEEANAPQNIKKTRNNKVRIIDDCNAIISAMETIRSRAYRVPELDEDGHAELVWRFADIIRDVRQDVDEAFRFGYD